jgi:4-amino-4-deoxy-L-arabinose transferase-like glycosyltransferase
MLQGISAYIQSNGSTIKTARTIRRVVEVTLIVVLSLAYIRGLFIPLMHNDAAHHANIAVHMFNNGDYVNLIDRGHDYLDKPHFLFWSAAFFYQWFGVTPFAYKLTSFLFSLLCIVSTYKLGSFLYNRAVGLLSAIILSTTYAFVLANNDVRMDAILTGSIVFAIWQLLECLERPRAIHVILAGIGLAIGFSTKGVIGVAVPAIAIGCHLIYKRRLIKLVSLEILAIALLTVVLITPVLWCYYLQFDLHPEKTIRGQSNISGILFILFGQNTERLAGTNFGSQGGGDYLFFFHTYVWAFLPWTIVGAAAFYKRLKWFITRKFRKANDKEFLTIGTVTVFILILTLANFKLPHYLNIILPLIAILTGSFVIQSPPKLLRRIARAQWVITVGTVLLLVVLNAYVFPVNTKLVIVILGVMIAIWIFIASFLNSDKKSTFILSVFSLGVLMSFMMNFNFFPSLLQYQAGQAIGNFIVRNTIPVSQVKYIEGCEYANDLDFALKRDISFVPENALADLSKGNYIVTGDTGLSKLSASKVRYKILAEAANSQANKFRIKFLNPETRAQHLRKLRLVVVE